MQTHFDSTGPHFFMPSSTHRHDWTKCHLYSVVLRQGEFPVSNWQPIPNARSSVFNWAVPIGHPPLNALLSRQSGVPTPPATVPRAFAQQSATCLRLPQHLRSIPTLPRLATWGVRLPRVKAIAHPPLPKVSCHCVYDGASYAVDMRNPSFNASLLGVISISTCAFCNKN